MQGNNLASGDNQNCLVTAASADAALPAHVGQPDSGSDATHPVTGDESDSKEGVLEAKHAGMDSVSAEITAANADTLLEGFRLVANYLLEMEACVLCGGVVPYEHSNKRLNYRAGYHRRMLRLKIGTVRVLVPHLRHMHVRPSIAKRMKRMEPVIVAALMQCLQFGVSTKGIQEIIRVAWTVDLAREILGQLTVRMTALLGEWRSSATVTTTTPAGISASDSPCSANITPEAPRPHSDAHPAIPPQGYAVY